MTVSAEAPHVPERSGRQLWSLDEYVVVADLYLRRGRSSGVQDPEVVRLAQLTGRSPASISRRLGNFDGTVRPGMGLKPVIGEPLAVFQSMQADLEYRAHTVLEARRRLEELSQVSAAGLGNGVRLVDPEAMEVEESEVSPPSATRHMVRAEAKLVHQYRQWRDPGGTRLRGLLIITADRTLRADLYDTSIDVLIEAKAEANRENIRYAVGQLIDYRRYLDPGPAIAILVPARLDADLAGLPAEVGAGVIWPLDGSFVDSGEGRFTGITNAEPSVVSRG
jgi:hypothetical protein